MPSVLARPVLVGGLFLAPWALATSETCGGEELTSLLQGGLRSVKRHEAAGTGAALGLPEQAVACGQSDFVKYPGYNGDLLVTGTVHVTAVAGLSASKHRQVLTFNVSGVDPRCDHGPSGEANSCGIHIHAGTTCELAGDGTDRVLGHYWNDSLRKKDPWACAAYTAEQKNEAGPWEACSFGLSVKTGIPPEEVPGHAVVVHDYEGGRVACAIIPKAPEPATAAPMPSEPSPADQAGGVLLTADSFTKYPDYDGEVKDVKVTGAVWITPTTGQCPTTPGQYISYKLMGLDTRCSMGPSSTANSCGVHVHEGTTCDDHTLVKGHYYNKDSTDAHSRAHDPWLCTAFTTCEKGQAADMLVEVTTGVAFESIKGRAFVVHDFEGKRMACGLIH